MKKTCLIIDDNLQDEMIEAIERKAKKKNIALACLQFNIGSSERQDLLTEVGKIDMVKVMESFKNEFHRIKLDLICIDFNLEDDTIDGLEVLKAIHPLRSHVPFMLYSANVSQLINKIIDGYDQDADKKKLLSKIKFLTRYKIEDFVDREHYDEAIIKIMSMTQKSMELIIEEKLLEYPDLVFHSTYPAFDGKTLEFIAEQIRNGSVHGDRYKTELIEQAISIMITLNND